MKHSTVVLTSVLTATLAINSVAIANNQTDKQAIIRGYRHLEVSTQRKNINQIMSIYAPEYTEVSFDGKVSNLQQARRNTQQTLQYIRRFNTIRYENTQIQINGQTANVIGKAYINAIMSNPKTPHLTTPMSITAHYEDTWKRTQRGWKKTNSRILQQTTTVPRPQGTPSYNYIYPNHQLYQQNIDMIRSGSRSLECAFCP